MQGDPITEKFGELALLRSYCYCTQEKSSLGPEVIGIGARVPWPTHPRGHI